MAEQTNGSGSVSNPPTALGVEASSTMRARIFIASSSEGLPLARALSKKLSKKHTPTVWLDDPPYHFSSVVEWLEELRTKYDACVAIFSPDDTTISRGVMSPSPRDNVLYELGFFQGYLARQNCFALVESTSGLKILSDLSGISLLGYSQIDVTLRGAKQAISGAVEGINRQLERNDQRDHRSLRGWWYQTTGKQQCVPLALDLVSVQPLYSGAVRGDIYRVYQRQRVGGSAIVCGMDHPRWTFSGQYEHGGLSYTYQPTELFSGTSFGAVRLVGVPGVSGLRGSYVRQGNTEVQEPVADGEKVSTGIVTRFLEWYQVLPAESGLTFSFEEHKKLLAVLDGELSKEPKDDIFRQCIADIKAAMAVRPSKATTPRAGGGTSPSRPGRRGRGKTSS